MHIDRKNTLLFAFAALAFLYAVLGNYVALPGYLNFLERGGTSAAGSSFDWAVMFGAIRTIAWMLAFNLGAICLYFAVLRTKSPDHIRQGAAIACVWMIFWSLPELPRPTAPFFLLFGSAILLLILTGSYLATGAPATGADSGNNPGTRRRFYLATSGLFFAMATWDVCGLGSTGRILHPDQVVLPRSQLLLQTQVIKLMLALCFAWLFGVLSLLGDKRAGNRPAS